MSHCGSWRLALRVAAAVSAIAVYFGAPAVAQADPIQIFTTNVWRADRTANPIGFPELAIVPWIDVRTLPGGNVADTKVTASIGASTYELQRIATGPLAGIYWTNIAYDPLLTGDWTIRAENDGDFVETTRPGFIPVDPMPFASSIFFTGTGTDITVHWTLTPESEARLDAQQVSIWDITDPTPQTNQSFAIGALPRSVQLTNLEVGRKYAVEITSSDRNAATGYIDAFSGNWLSGWVTTENEVQLPREVPEPASVSLLLVGAALGIRRLRRRPRG